MRRLLVLLHRYVGLFLGAFLLLEAVTGCAIVFEEELDGLLHPQLHPPRREAPLAPLDDVVRQASAALQGNWQLLALRFPRQDGAAAVALFRGRAEPGAAPPLRQVFVDVHSAAVLGQRGPNDTVLQVLKRLHADLYLGEPGMLLLLAVTFGCLLLGMTGPVLWQPKGWNPIGWFRVNWGANPLRRYLDLHKVAGFWLLPLIAATAVTSIYMLKPPLAETAVASVFPLQLWHAPQLTLTPPGDGQVLPPGRIVALAQARHPDAQVRNLRFPPAPSRPYVVELAEPGEMNDGRSGSIEVRIAPASGAILHEITRAGFSTGDHIMYWQYPLHNGHAFGLAGRILVFIGGAALALLFATGFYLWYKKNAASAASKRRKRERASAGASPRQALPGHPAHEPDQHPV